MLSEGLCKASRELCGRDGPTPTRLTWELALQEHFQCVSCIICMHADSVLFTVVVHVDYEWSHRAMPGSANRNMVSLRLFETDRSNDLIVLLILNELQPNRSVPGQGALGIRIQKGSMILSPCLSWHRWMLVVPSAMFATV